MQDPGYEQRQQSHQPIEATTVHEQVPPSYAAATATTAQPPAGAGVAAPSYYPPQQVSPAQAQPSVVVQAVPVAYENLAGPPETRGRSQQHEVAICRRCGKEFLRPAGTKRGNSSYFRCKKCDGLKVEDIVASCGIS
mmetsp:Transcript_2972/g.4381  ORF Transcript_2972/g.4381 Transcript_2972/m.4381 type:complete len:137 (-) Transcript_2972:338-748(-)